MRARSVTALSLLALGLLELSPAGAAEAREVRALWVIRTALVSPESVDRVVDAAAEAGINTLLVQVRGRGDAFYPSRVLPRSELLAGQPPDFDPFARLLSRARTRGLAVHAWINVLLSANYGQKLDPAHELARHPEWMMVPRASAAAALRSGPRGLKATVWRGAKDGDAEGYYLSPAAPGVAEHLEAIVKETLERYAVDGLHLDFIRFPGPDYDYSRAALRAFGPGRSDRELLAGPAFDEAAWNEWRRESVTRLVDRLAKAARTTRKEVLVSAAVVPDRATAVEHKLQDWPVWLETGLLDVVCPMVYTTDDRIFRRQAEDARALAGPKRALWVGIGAYRLSVEGVVARVRLAREAGAEGFVLFSHEFLMSRADRMRLAAAFRGAATPAGAGAINVPAPAGAKGP